MYEDQLEDLKALSEVAYQQEDWIWLHEICRKIDDLELIKVGK